MQPETGLCEATLSLNNHESLGAAGPMTAAGTRHILSVHLEDWFQVGAFHRLIDRDQWYRFETRLEHNAAKTLELLDRFHTKATFFVLGWVAEQLPHLVAEIARQGHEIAACDFAHRCISELTPRQFRDDIVHSRDVIEAAANQKVLGFRTANGWLTNKELWALDVLAQEGFAYDSSLLPKFFGGASTDPRQRFVHQRDTAGGPLWEVPPSTWPCCGFNVPIAGGNWFRQLPHRLLKRAIATHTSDNAAPFVMYFHAWELDPEQPRISAADRVTQVRHYRNLDKMKWVLEDYLSKYQFGTVADRLGLTVKPLDNATIRRPVDTAAEPITLNSQSHASTPTAAGRDLKTQSVTIVIPCYNEEATLPYLARTLERLEFELGTPTATTANPTIYRPTFLLVDDRSADNTWEVMQRVFGNKSNCLLVRHEKNSGVSAAILTGIKHAPTDIVCSMDCDCSYDPLELKHMLPLMTDDTSLVTASPYHPQGRVKNVPGWRLFLSKGLSTLYRCVLPARLHTWTSCFRIYRKSDVERLNLQEGGFLGTAELVAELALAGKKIVEHPATLEVRIFGESKMKTMRTIRGHLRLIGRLIKQRSRTVKQ